MKEIYISCGSTMGMTTNTKKELRLKLEKLGYTVISNYKSLIVTTSTAILSDLANIYFISGTLSEAKLDGIRADLLFYKYGDIYFTEKALQHFKTCVLYEDVEDISRYIDSEIREDITDPYHSVINYCINDIYDTDILYKRMLNTKYGTSSFGYDIKAVKFNGPATIVFWTDGTKTVAKCSQQEEFDPEKGLAIAIAKRLIGDDAHLIDVFNKWVPKKVAERKPLIFDLSRMECVCPRCERITDAPWDDSKSPFYCRYCGQKIIFPEK